MKKSRQVRTENLYNICVQTDYITGLCVAYMLGAENWTLFFVLLAVSIGLGFLTVKLWVKTIKEITNERFQSD